MKIVADEDTHVNASPEEVYQWAERAGERGLLNPTTARLKVSAMKRVLTVLADDEQLGAQAIVDGLDALVSRLARKEGGTPETLTTYKQRTDSLLRDFIEYHRDPLTFQARSAERPAKSSQDRRKKEGTKSSATPVLPAPPVDATPQGTRRYVYPLGGGRDFEYVLPSDGLSMREVKKVALLLISLANDYEPHGDAVADLTRRVRAAGQIQPPDFGTDDEVAAD